MKTANRNIWRLVLALGLVVLTGRPVFGGEYWDVRGWNAANDREMNGIRGGFVSIEGIEFTFGIEKEIYVDGVLKATNSLNIANAGGGLPTLVPGQNRESLLTLVQNGPGNSFFTDGAGKFQSGFFTVIQNSLDRQTITNIDKITTTISVLGLYREINQASTLNQQTIQSLR